MELNNKMLVKLAFFLFLMGFSATIAAGRRHLDNPNMVIAQILHKHALKNRDFSPATKVTAGGDEEEKECCKSCACTLTWPHRVCVCGDIHKEACPASCKSCICEESEEYGQYCYCGDLGDGDCYVPSCRY